MKSLKTLRNRADSLLASKGNKPRRGKVFQCKTCGASFYVSPIFVKTAKYCSRPCQFKGQENHLILKCKQCEGSYRTYKSHVKHRGSSCCSKTCLYKYRSKVMQGAGSPLWKGGISSRLRCLRNGAAWARWRKKVFDRDGYTCQDCGVRGGYLEPHHIKPFAFFPTLRFEVSNGLTLCKSCHGKTKMSAKEMRKVYAT